MSEKQIEDVLWAFRERVLDLRKDRAFRYILIFKNHGEAAGASLEHPHSQLIALPVVPKKVKEEIQAREAVLRLQGALHLLRHRATGGARKAPRVVTETDRFLVMEPYAPRFPFETWVIPKVHSSHFEESDASLFQNLAWVLRSTFRKTRKGSGESGVQFRGAQRAGAGTRTGALSLAHRDHAQAHEGGRLRVGHGFLHQSNTTGGIGEVSSRSRSRVIGCERRAHSDISFQPGWKRSHEEEDGDNSET